VEKVEKWGPRRSVFVGREIIRSFLGGLTRGGLEGKKNPRTGHPEGEEGGDRFKGETDAGTGSGEGRKRFNFTRDIEEVGVQNAKLGESTQMEGGRNTGFSLFLDRKKGNLTGKHPSIGGRLAAKISLRKNRF